VLRLAICRENCIAKQCWQTGENVRLDEITGSLAGEEKEQRFILSAIPLYDDRGVLVGAVELQRNVTDEAIVQDKYQRQMDVNAESQAQLELDLAQRTRQLMAISRRLYAAQRAIHRMKTELFG
jgi:hypothetical protein